MNIFAALDFMNSIPGSNRWLRKLGRNFQMQQLGMAQARKARRALSNLPPPPVYTPSKIIIVQK